MTVANMMQRIVVTFLLSLLLVGTQQEAQRHALEHLRPLLTRAHDVGFQSPVVEVACAECALLVGGADAVIFAVDALPGPAPDRERLAFVYASRALAAPAYFQSRAPPVLL